MDHARRGHSAISIHVLRVEDDQESKAWLRRWEISIHVLRVEDDDSYFCTSYPAKKISIHVLRVEDDGKNREKSLFAFI